MAAAFTIIANARQKNPTADVCPPAKHSTKKGMKERESSNAISHASLGISFRVLQIRKKPAT